VTREVVYRLKTSFLRLPSPISRLQRLFRCYPDILGGNARRWPPMAVPRDFPLSLPLFVRVSHWGQRGVSFDHFLSLSLPLFLFTLWLPTRPASYEDDRFRIQLFADPSQFQQSPSATEPSWNLHTTSHVLTTIFFARNELVQIAQNPCLKLKSEIERRAEFIDSVIRDAWGNALDYLYVLLSLFHT